MDAFDLFQPIVRFKIHEGLVFFCGNTVAWVLENHITTENTTQVTISVETYRFEEDGSVAIRTFYNVPPKGDDEVGRVFRDYLPEDGSEPYAQSKASSDKPG